MSDSILVIKKEDITNILSSLVGIVEKRNVIQQLSHVKIEAKGSGEVSFTTNDMDISITKSVKVEKCSILKSFTLPAITLYDIVKKFPAQSFISFTQNKNNIEITSGSVFFSLPFLESDDFPTIEEGELPLSFSLTRENFTAFFSKTKFVISTEESRYNLTGLYLHTQDDELRAVTTDGHRLAVSTLKFSLKKFGILISRKTIFEMVKIFNKQEIKIFLSSNKVKFVCENTVLIAKLIAAEFPHYQKIIPKEYKKIVSLNKEEFIFAVDRVSAIYIDKAKSVRLSFNDVLTVSTSNSDSSNARETLKINYTGESFEICFNYSYLLEMLHHIDGDEVRINFNDSNSAAMIENGNTIYIIMPMSV